VALWVRADAEPATGPSVACRAEALPFRDDSFDRILCTQLLGLVEDPWRVAAEMARVLRPGGRVWLTAPAAWPYDSARAEHRFGAPDFAVLLRGLTVREVEGQGGMLALPFALWNTAVREAVRAAERRLPALAGALRLPARAAYVAANVGGRVLEGLAARGPLAPLLGYLDRRLPMNFLVVADKQGP
jgi:SAM-dependent methyltransferase